ncbi:MAG: HAMP domain-containing protein [Deltaproteobacteria bacterium]|nr:HAMP domain-containing protein [Deltaproteobacteria bacterium]
MNLTVKFFLSVTCLVTVIIALAMLTTLKQETSFIEAKMKKKGYVLAEVMAMASVNGFLSYDYSMLKRYFDTVCKDEDVILVMILDNEGRIKMHSDIDQIGIKLNDETTLAALNVREPVFQEMEEERLGKIYYFTAPIMVESQKLGIVRFAMSNAEIIRDTSASRNRLLLIGLAAILLGGLGAVLMGRMISKPLRQLAAGARAVSRGDLNWKIDIRGQDEIGVLAEAFSYMVSNLRKSIDSLVLAEKMASIGKLASTIAHEVRNPMEPIKGSAEILQQAFPANEKIVKYTRIIKDEISGVCDFLDHFLNFARPPKFSVGPVNVNDVLKETLSLIDHYIGDHNLVIEKNLDDGLPVISGNERQIKQLFLNLVMNAVQAMRDDQPGKLTIGSSLRSVLSPGNEGDSRYGRYVSVEFCDSGKGIALEDLNRIFEPFHTTKEDGTGLGLAIGRTIMNRHGGFITVESELGRWTRVTAHFPADPADETSTNQHVKGFL